MKVTISIEAGGADLKLVAAALTLLSGGNASVTTSKNESHTVSVVPTMTHLEPATFIPNGMGSSGDDNNFVAGGCDGGDLNTAVAPGGEVGAETPLATVSLTPEPSATTSPPEYDCTGLIWDTRIHSGNKAKNADGTWRKKRGVSAETYQSIEAELRGTQSPSQPAVPTSQPPVTAPSVVPPNATTTPPITMSPLPPAMAQAVAAQQASAQQPVQHELPIPPQPVPTVPQPMPTFPDIMNRISEGFKSQKIGQSFISEMSQATGVASITELNGNQNALIKAAALLAEKGL